mmetsp:Transcript_78543/g.230402  ORF Transcript_78543/g.230402 Transcript_78543/m.230402 type:complete len:242 (-) Transcript_78543:1270-1995(-)
MACAEVRLCSRAVNIEHGSCHGVVQLGRLLHDIVDLGAKLETIERDHKLKEVMVLRSWYLLPMGLHEPPPGEAQSRQFSEQHEVRVRYRDEVDHGSGNLIEAPVEERGEVKRQLGKVVQIEPIAILDDADDEVITPPLVAIEECREAPLAHLRLEHPQVGPALVREPRVQEHGVKLSLSPLEERAHREGERGQVHDQRGVPKHERIHKDCLQRCVVLHEVRVESILVDLDNLPQDDKGLLR